MVNFPLERLCQPWNSIFVIAPGSPTVSSSSISVFKFYLRLQSSNSIFDFNLQILSSHSVFKFYFHIQSSNSIFDFNLRASFARLSFQVNKSCWKSPKLNRRILAFFFEKNIFDVSNKPRTNATSCFYRIFDRRDVS